MIAVFTYSQIIATLYLVGLIWFVQVVHYPLFFKVGENHTYHLAHQRKTTYVVAPMMLIEGVSAVVLYVTLGTYTLLIGLIILVIIWLSTFFVQVPCHMKLKQGYSDHVVNRLVKSNWIRTIGWTARIYIVLAVGG